MLSFGRWRDPLAKPGRALRMGAATSAGLLLLASSQAQALWHFTDVTADAGVIARHAFTNPSALEQVHLVSGGVAAGDYDRDGWVDLYVVRGDVGPNLLFRNEGDGTFTERAAAAGVALGPGAYSGPTFADFDGDGWLDLLVLGVGGLEPVLFRNQGDGSFADVSASSGLGTGGQPSISAAFGDYDRDGDLDLFLTHWGALLTPSTAGHLWQNQGDGSFVDVSEAAGIPLFHSTRPGFPPVTLSFTPNFTDIDGDGWVDLLVSADFGASRVLRNQTDGTFADVTDPSVITDENGMGSAIGDYDLDGDLDWFVSSIWDPNGVAEGTWGITGNRLYRNEGDGSFVDATDAAGVRQGYWGWGATFADLDDDGLLDLFHVNGWGLSTELSSAEYHADPARCFVADGSGGFTESAAALGLADTGQGRGVVAFDYDRDGDLDLFLSNFGGLARLLRNDGDEHGRFLAVKLVGRSPNTEAIGARVYLTAGGRTQLREIRAGSNFESQDPAEAHFGLGDATVVDTLRVVWPSGAETVLEAVAPDRHLSLTERSEVADACTDSAPANPCSPGGRAASECALEWRLEPAPPRDKKGLPASLLRCREGDPACDHDPDLGNRSCTFRQALCINNSDQRLPKCSPSGLLRAELRRPNPAKRLDATGLGHLETLRAQLDDLGLGATGEVFGNVTPDACTTARDVVVPLVQTRRGKLKPGRRLLAVRVLRADGKADVDVLKLECLPPG